ncbi:MAG: hypothetical protein Q7K35_03125 [bacterium]|nr:hypothetical protein [bacterium]
MILSKYQKFSLKNKIIVMIVGFVLIIFGLIYFIVVPTIEDIQTMSQKIEEQMVDLEKKYIKGSSLRQLTENLKKIEPKLSSLDQIFINKNRELEFITTIENEANNSQVSQKINLSSPKNIENQELQKNNLQLSTNGNFNNQLKYLINLESLSYYINVKSLELTPAAGNEKTTNQDQTETAGKSGVINMLIDADTYWE